MINQTIRIGIAISALILLALSDSGIAQEIIIRFGQHAHAAGVGAHRTHRLKVITSIPGDEAEIYEEFEERRSRFVAVADGRPTEMTIDWFDAYEVSGGKRRIYPWNHLSYRSRFQDAKTLTECTSGPADSKVPPRLSKKHEVYLRPDPIAPLFAGKETKDGAVFLDWKRTEDPDDLAGTLDALTHYILRNHSDLKPVVHTAYLKIDKYAVVDIGDLAQFDTTLEVDLPVLGADPVRATLKGRIIIRGFDSWPVQAFLKGTAERDGVTVQIDAHLDDMWQAPYMYNNFNRVSVLGDHRISRTTEAYREDNFKQDDDVVSASERLRVKKTLEARVVDGKVEATLHYDDYTVFHGLKQADAAPFVGHSVTLKGGPPFTLIPDDEEIWDEKQEALVRQDNLTFPGVQPIVTPLRNTTFIKGDVLRLPGWTKNADLNSAWQVAQAFWGHFYEDAPGREISLHEVSTVEYRFLRLSGAAEVEGQPGPNAELELTIRGQVLVTLPDPENQAASKAVLRPFEVTGTLNIEHKVMMLTTGEFAAEWHDIPGVSFDGSEYQLDRALRLKIEQEKIPK